MSSHFTALLRCNWKYLRSRSQKKCGKIFHRFSIPLDYAMTNLYNRRSFFNCEFFRCEFLIKHLHNAIATMCNNEAKMSELLSVQSDAPAKKKLI